MDSTDITRLDFLLREVVHYLNRHTRSLMNEKSMTMARFWVLNAINSEPFTMRDLQRRLFLAPATLTGLVDGLVDGGYVRRWREERDRRVVFLALTPQGHELLEQVYQLRRSLLEKALLSCDINLKQFNDHLELLLENLVSIPLEED